MLRKLLGATDGFAIIMALLDAPKDGYSLNDITRRTGLRKPKIKKALASLKRASIVATPTRQTYTLDHTFSAKQELIELERKMRRWALERAIRLLDGKQKLLKLVLLSGSWIGASGAPVDLLIVGRINRLRARRVLRSLERQTGEPLRFTFMTYDEFRYRRDVADRFLTDVLDASTVPIIDRIDYHH